MSIVFSVIDINCQAADDSFFTPQARLTTKSTTSYATLYGYSEFAPSVSPPRKYKKVTLQGFSERIGFTAEETPRQCAGAKYVYLGDGEVDSKGHQISSYAKNFYAQCAKQYWPEVPLQANPDCIYPDSGSAFHRYVGYCWPVDPNSCSVCDSNQESWPFLGNQATNSIPVDLAGFIHNVNAPVITPTSWSINDSFSGLTSLVVNREPGQPLPPTNNDGFPQETLPASDGNSYEGAYTRWTNNNVYSAVLSDQYTDAEALANAQVVTGTGTTAQNMPRTTGFTSVTTDVEYTLLLSNLISGRDYSVAVDLWDKSENGSTHTPKIYLFTASSSTHSITDTIATPVAGHTTTVQKPTIAFST